MSTGLQKHTRTWHHSDAHAPHRARTGQRPCKLLRREKKWDFGNWLPTDLLLSLRVELWSTPTPETATRCSETTTFLWILLNVWILWILWKKKLWLVPPSTNISEAFVLEGEQSTTIKEHSSYNPEVTTCKEIVYFIPANIQSYFAVVDLLALVKKHCGFLKKKSLDDAYEWAKDVCPEYGQIERPYHSALVDSSMMLPVYNAVISHLKSQS